MDCFMEFSSFAVPILGRRGGAIVSPLEHLSMSSDDWSQAATLAWLLQLNVRAAADGTVDCLRMGMHCVEAESQRSPQLDSALVKNATNTEPNTNEFIF